MNETSEQLILSATPQMSRIQLTTTLSSSTIGKLIFQSIFFSIFNHKCTHIDLANGTTEQNRRRNSSVAKLLGGHPLHNQQYEGKTFFTHMNCLLYFFFDRDKSTNT